MNRLMNICNYIDKLNTRYKSGISRENSYRGDLQRLLETLLDDDILVTNEPARVKCGAPDYILTKGKIPVCYIEAKDIEVPDLAGKKRNKEQFNRYKATGDPFIFTDYLDFRFYNNDEHITSIRIAEVKNGKNVAKKGKYLVHSLSWMNRMKERKKYDPESTAEGSDSTCT